VPAAPSDGSSRRAAFQRLHFGGIGFLPVAFIERGADGAAEQPTGGGADHRSGNAAARSAPAENSAKRAASNGSGDGAGILPRRIRIVCTTCYGCGHKARRKDLCWQHAAPPRSSGGT